MKKLQKLLLVAMLCGMAVPAMDAAKKRVHEGGDGAPSAKKPKQNTDKDAKHIEFDAELRGSVGRLPGDCQELIYLYLPIPEILAAARLQQKFTSLHEKKNPGDNQQEIKGCRLVVHNTEHRVKTILIEKHPGFNLFAPDGTINQDEANRLLVVSTANNDQSGIQGALYAGADEKWLRICQAHPGLTDGNGYVHQAVANNLLVFSTVNNDPQGILDALYVGADVDTVDQNGDTALIYAAGKKGRFKTVKLLLDHGANVNAFGEKNTTALISAANAGFLNVVQLLLDHDANVNAINNFGATALIRGLSKPSRISTPKITQILIAHGADVNTADLLHNTALICAAHTPQTSDTGHVKLLLDSGADVNAVGFMNQTALSVARRNGNTKIIEMIEEEIARRNAEMP